MNSLILKIFDYFTRHRSQLVMMLAGATFLLIVLASSLGYKEDIADFLPHDAQLEAMDVYQDIAGADRIFAIFECSDSTRHDPDLVVSCIDKFVDHVTSADSVHHVASTIVSQIDLEQMQDIMSFAYSNAPYFLSDADYVRIDSMLAQPDYVDKQLAKDKQMLLFPSADVMTQSIASDPLNLFSPTLQRLRGASASLKYSLYDGHIFSPDTRKAIVMMTSPYGSSETEKNAALTQMLKMQAKKAEAECMGVEIHLTGAPVIAVGNAKQIKTDSMISVAIAALLILLLLWVTMRSWRSILLIAVTIAWGWLLAIGVLALVHDKVSIIVIGISSVILGIAVNYPLHFIAHLDHTPQKRKALAEIVAPLLTGNITTVGAFLTLVPLQSVALRDLGLFSSFLLIGTIVFVIIFLPHLTSAPRIKRKHTFVDSIAQIRLEHNTPTIVAVVILTLVFGWFSLNTTFDSDMSHINYMTSEQRADMEYFQKTMVSSDESSKIYAVSTGANIDEALEKSQNFAQRADSLVATGKVFAHEGCTKFICSKAEQARRLSLWQHFVESHGADIKRRLQQSAQAQGFAPDAFDEFTSTLNGNFKPQPISYFEPLKKQMFASCFSNAGGKTNVVDVIKVDKAQVESTESTLKNWGYPCFDASSMSRAITNHLSDNFNYIGFACGFIVFFFLWLSMGSIELAILSFVPMAVSWIWILGIMSIFGIQFNIVNIILATFIFGQGDDYTIFMTEGASYEYAYRRKMLAAYKHSIIISALIMFIGIGTLIVARHPALRSLAEVTIAGMFSVVLMACIFPPLLFGMLVQKHTGCYRLRPLSLPNLLSTIWLWTMLAVIYCTSKVLRCTSESKDSQKSIRRRKSIASMCGFALHHIPILCYKQDFCNKANFHHDTALLTQDSSVLSLLALASCTICEDKIAIEQKPCGIWVKRWAKLLDINILPDIHEAILWARRHNQALTPLFVHGINEAMPQGSNFVFAGNLTVSVRKEVNVGNDTPIENIAASICHEYAEWVNEQENAEYFKPLVLDRFRYKGTEIYGEVKHNLKKQACYSSEIDAANASETIIVDNRGWGEYALLMALVHKQAEVVVHETDADRADLLKYCAEELAPNLQIEVDDESADKVETEQ